MTEAGLHGETVDWDCGDTQERLDMWPGIRRRVEDNVERIVQELDPMAGARDHVVFVEMGEMGRWINEMSNHYLRELLGLQRWRTCVRESILLFDDGLSGVRRGSVHVADLAVRHRQMVRSFSGQDFFNLGRGA